MKTITDPNWKVGERGEYLLLPGSRKIQIQTECRTLVFVREKGQERDDEILAALGEGRIECEFKGFREPVIFIETDARVWVRDDMVKQRSTAVVGTAFVEPMKRETMSPEMRQMQRMLRLNDLHREAQMQEWMELIDERTKRLDDREASLQGQLEVLENSIIDDERLGYGETEPSAGGTSEEGGDHGEAGDRDAQEPQGGHVAGSAGKPPARPGRPGKRGGRKSDEGSA